MFSPATLGSGIYTVQFNLINTLQSSGMFILQLIVIYALHQNIT